MKHLLTPATPPPSAAFGGRGPAIPSVSIVEEYYTSKKGPLFATAVVAGTNAVKQVSSLVPFCYPTPIQRCSFTFRRRQVLQPPRSAQMPHRVVLRRRTSEPGPQQSRPEYSVLYCFCTVATENRGGVEMEALTGAMMASVTLYDMLKGLPGAQEDGLSLGEAFVLAKRGGRNDFTKLLMSEPERPLVESGLRSGGAEIHALSPISGAVNGGGVQPPTGATHASPSAATATGTSRAATLDANGHASANAEQARVEGQEASEEVAEEEDYHSAAKRVIRRPAPATATAHDVVDGSAAPGDADAWWRSSKHEKRLQELYPRRKYGDNARLVPPSPAPMTPVSPVTRARTRTGPSASSDSGAEVVAGTAAVLAARPKLASKASMIRDRQASSAGKGPASTAALPKVARRPEPTGSIHEADEADEEDDMVEHRRSSNRSRLAKKSARAAASAVEADDEDNGKPAAAAAEEEEEADEEAATTTSTAVDEVDEEEGTAMTAAAKKRRHSTAVTAAPKSHAATITAKSLVSGKRTQTGHKRYLAEVEDEAAAAEEDEDATEDNEGADAEARMPVKGSAAAATRKAHAHGGATGRRTGKDAIERPSRSFGASGRKQRAGRVTPRKGRASAEPDDYHDDEDMSAPEERDDGIEEDDTAAGDENDNAVSAAAERRRGKAAVKQIRPAAPKRGGTLRPVRHDSWDVGFSQRSRHDAGDGDGDEGHEDAVEEEEAEAAETIDEDGEGDEAEDVTPPPPPRKKLKKPLKRAAPKRR
ncbi:putative molybdenum cofactor biosynthesis protein [Leishmania major strain Friedlin]|uniref:Putative molybdenum cofactor biosynthesis protein n=1 Tax=Leishmania major TaxID=5664 RepID=Q4Q7Z8_LEIMA|nr:putative molybdenum cofactor biosynthesis protein [Leishmania major strain Friedlin]CAG9577380.1 molybdenum_cofactor_biosynthesis_protein_-_putative [Leishmania major strain Friedlin]CAJ05722.1 putative molybdenum cofactor biosynthesis protein [Leishmania major strain Friedlin]|eukprot:XP_001684550.1 putative molybdenum cofactor biosynthesis protein [Leishmania major strain Friedlin]